ncbi:uncharacterized protein LOC143182496 [Calliopsis andreniformis]|uniref:uncharacterized protein LOC143182496 n=1 Tax=Calliopsis andreniformis TaxID=337506 RepID=UPI003FCD94C5
MPETAIIPKSPSSLSASTSSREDPSYFPVEKRLTRCVQRKFQGYSQLPIRCQKPSTYYRPPRTSFRLAGLATINCTASLNTAKSCPDNVSVFRVISTPRCKKSLSMSDLSLSVMEVENSNLGSDSNSTLEKLDEGEKMYAGSDVGISVGIKKWMDGFVLPESEDGGSRLFQNPRKAATLVCRSLMLNAWRRRREEVLCLHDTIDDLTEKIKNMHLQVFVLRRLIDTENGRVSRLTGEVHRVRIRFEETLKEKDELTTEKEKMEEEMKRLSELSEERLVAAENVRNELHTAQSQLRALDEQISKDREKLLKLREEKQTLETKVVDSETLAMQQETRAEKAEAIVEDLQSKLATQIALVESLKQQIQHYSKELKMKEDETLRLEKRLRSSEEIGKSLNLRTIFLEAQLADREAALRHSESNYNSQLLELNEMRERLIRQSQERGWSSRMLQIAGSVIRAPRAILRTFLSTTTPALTA